MRDDTSEPAVVLDGVTKIFRNRPGLAGLFARERRTETSALRNVSLSATRGEVFVLLGPNGSGKTTLLKLISTMLLPDAGKVLVNGTDTFCESHRVRAAVGFAVASERSFFPRLTAAENLDFFAALDNVTRSERRLRVHQMLDQVGLGAHAGTLAMKFSSGMYQRLGIARALLKQPSILLLDEPTRSIDPGAISDFWDVIRSMAAWGCCVMLATHNLEEALAVGDSFAFLRRGELVAQERAATLDSVEGLRQFYFQRMGLEVVSGGTLLDDRVPEAV